MQSAFIHFIIYLLFIPSISPVQESVCILYYFKNDVLLMKYINASRNEAG